MLVLEWKGGAFIEKVNSRCFCWFPAAIFVDSFCPPIRRLHLKLYKGAWNVSATNSETVGHKDLRFGQIVYILVFYNISFSWLLPLDGFKCIFCSVFIAWQWKRRIWRKKYQLELTLWPLLQIFELPKTCMDPPFLYVRPAEPWCIWAAKSIAICKRICTFPLNGLHR